ncbi:MAG: PEP-CTERM sorting domain-containing protein [Candidatus Acidiferrales bacterium]
MMKRVTCLALFIVALILSATVARADSTNDFRVILNDPTCPSGANCVDLGYNGQSGYVGILNPVVFWSPTPSPIPQGQTAACSSNFFSHCLDLVAPYPLLPLNDPLSFYGVAFWGGTLTADEDLTIGVSGTSLSVQLPDNFECDNAACPNGIITLTPEPSAALLLLSGLVFLAVFRRRFRTPLPA